jgi:hypothetical protein
MKPFDRLAWRCSWIAPIGLVAGFVSLFAYMEAVRRQVGENWRTTFVVVSFVSWSIGVVTHLVVHYHAIKAGSLSSLKAHERDRLDVALRFSGGYGAWRSHMRREHPELRGDRKPRDNATDGRQKG